MPRGVVSEDKAAKGMEAGKSVSDFNLTDEVLFFFLKRRMKF
jgi:hypothetical protein